MLGAPPAFVLSQDQTLNVDHIKIPIKENLIILSEQLWRCFHRLMFLRNYFLESLKRKIPGSFVSHIRYCLIFKLLISATGKPVRDAVSLTAYLFYTAFSICQEVFENFFSEVFEALRASNLPKGFQSPPDPGFIWGSVSGGVTLSPLAATCLVYPPCPPNVKRLPHISA